MIKCIFLLLAPVSWSLSLQDQYRCPDGLECPEDSAPFTINVKRAAAVNERKLPMFGAIWQNNIGKREALPLFSGVLPRRSAKREAVVRRSSIPLFSRVLQYKPSKRELPERRSNAFPMFSGMLHFKPKRAQDRRHIPLFSGVFQQRGFDMLKDTGGKRNIMPSFSMILRKKNIAEMYDDSSLDRMMQKRQYWNNDNMEDDIHFYHLLEDSDDQYLSPGDSDPTESLHDLGDLEGHPYLPHGLDGHPYGHLLEAAEE